MKMIYVVTWEYGDKSSFGVLDAYHDRELANKFVDKVAPISDRQFQIHEVELISPNPSNL